MIEDRKYLAAVAVLAVIAVVFGVTGIVAPAPAVASPRQTHAQSSSPVTHFAYPPSYDSGWMNITDKCGQFFNITHGLGTTDLVVDITGKTQLNGGEHQRNFGGTGYEPSWSRQYGTINTEEAMSLVQTSDDGYALAGYTSASGRTDFWLVKTDPTGGQQWSRLYGGPDTDVAYSLIQTDDGGYALAGYTAIKETGVDFWLVKTNPSGNLQWSKAYGGIGVERAYSLIQTIDGGFALAGSSNSSAQSYDFWLVKTDASGNMQWNATFGGAGDDGAYTLIQTSDGGYALAGYTYSFGAGSSDAWLVKTDSVGTMQWNKTYGGSGFDEVYSMVLTGQYGFALAGRTNSFGDGALNYWLIRTDLAGTIEWHRPYGSGGANSVIETAEGGFAVGGNGFASLIKVDSSGNLQWTRKYSGSTHSIIETRGGGFALAGLSGNDFWLQKSSVESGLAWTGTTNSTITLYRGTTDAYWNFVRVRLWTIQEPTWQFGDINQDGKVDVQDLYIVSKNYGTAFSAVSLTGIVAISSVHSYKKRKNKSS